MSRLRAITIPFATGHDDRTASELLPDGVFADVRNGRLNKVGELALRRGWRPVTMAELSSGATVVAEDLYSYGDSLVALCRVPAASTGAGRVLATLVEANATRPWRVNYDTVVPAATRVRTVGNLSPVEADCTRCSVAITNDGAYGIVCAAFGATLVYRVFEVATDQTLAYGDFSSGVTSWKAVSLGATLGVVTHVGNTLRLSTVTPTSTNPGIVSTATLVSATIVEFDAATSRASTPASLHVAYTTATDVFYANFTLAGVQNGSTKTVASVAATGVAVCSDDTAAHVAWQVTSTDVVRLLTFGATDPFTTTTGPTDMFSAAAVMDRKFCIATTEGQTPNVIFVAGEFQTGGVSDKVIQRDTMSQAHAQNATTRFRASNLTGGFLVTGARAALGITRDSAAHYTDPSSPWWCDDYGTGDVPASGYPYAPGQSASTTALAIHAVTNGDYVAPLVRACALDDGERRPGVTFSGSLYLTGGVLLQWSGNDLVDNGIHAPVIESVTNSNGAGTLGNGTYKYRAVLVYTDERGQTHRSIVSTEFSNTLTGADDTAAVAIRIPKGLRRNANLISNPRVELYRTEGEGATGELFYRCGTAATLLSNDAVTVTDTLPDASLLSQPRLYVEGEFGGTSGVLDITPPLSSAYIGAMRDRLVLGTAGVTYQVSQITLPNEPVCFTQAGISSGPGLAYLDTVEAPLTMATALDDTIVLGTRDALYIAGGEGPNLSGIGEFQSPARLPSDVGVYDWRSVLETSEGLWFLATSSALFALPRGGGAPQFAGEPVQSRFTGECVGAARDTADDIAAWAVAGSSPALVVRSARDGHWFGDPLPFTPAALVSHQGQMYAVASDGVVWRQEASAYGDGAAGATAVALRATTGPVQAFGLAGHGRVATVELLGTFQSAATILMEMSYDDGATWTSLGSHTVSGLSAGQAFQRQWHPARQRGGRFRLRATMTPSATTAEGCRLTGLTVYLTERSGPSRLDSAKRR